MAAKFVAAMQQKMEDARRIRGNLINAQSGMPKDAEEFSFGITG